MSDDKFVECKVDNWEMFMRLSASLQTQQWLFRGHTDSSWSLQTAHERYLETRVNKILYKIAAVSGPALNFEALFAEDELKPTEQSLKNAENFAIHNFQKDASRFSISEKRLDLLAAMQHYGAPTRLLDVTSSLFVALYFAFESDFFSDKFLKPKAIWGFKKEQLLHGQAELETVKKVKKHYEAMLKSNPQYAPDVYEGGILSFLENEHQQQVECLNLVERILTKDSKDMKGIVPVVPDYYNERISAQSGSFLFSINLLDSFENNLKQTLKISNEEFNQPKEYSIQDYFDGKFDFQSARLIKFVFDPKKCHSADDILRCANISAKNLFPDLTGIAKSIKY